MREILKCHVPIVIIAADDQASSTLKALGKARGVMHAKMKRPSRKALAERLPKNGSLFEIYR